MIDFHTHLLPKIDDGSRSLEETEQMLNAQWAQGIQIIIATPHFYPNQDMDTFLRQRQESYDQVREMMNQKGIEGEIRMGAEILLSIDTPSIDNLRALAIEGTNYLLIELYSGEWSEWMYTALQAIIHQHKLIPIIAHVERYEWLAHNFEPINRLVSLGVLFQVNVQSLHPKSRKRGCIKKLMRHHLVHVIGSDVHRQTHFVSVKEGYQWIETCYGKKQVERIQKVSQHILEGTLIQYDGYKPYKRFLGRWY